MDSETNQAEFMNEHRDGWCVAMGVVFDHVTPDRVSAHLEIGEQHLQAFGIVHGGVYAGLIETLASVGAALHAMANDRAAVGLENSTTFLHAVRSGTLRGVATPLTRGRRTHVWQVDITDDAGRLAASGRVRLLAVEPGTTR